MVFDRLSVADGSFLILPPFFTCAFFTLAVRIFLADACSESTRVDTAESVICTLLAFEFIVTSI